MSFYPHVVSVLLFAPAALTAQSLEQRTLRFMTYNVAGLPEPISASSPAKNSEKIGELINPYDIVLVQEDFNYHNKLSKTALHPYRSQTSGWAVFGDGLNSFSKLPFRDLERIKWKNCHGVFTDGSDCLTPKGILFARYEIAAGIFVDIYDLHADAGSDEKSMEARRKNMTQLVNLINEKSRNSPVIIMGDFNSRYTRNGDIAEIILAAGFEDSWIVSNELATPPEKGLALTNGCATDLTGPFCELIDKIYFRSAENLQISLVNYEVPSDVFIDSYGEPLSDHIPVAAELNFQFMQN